MFDGDHFRTMNHLANFTQTYFAAFLFISLFGLIDTAIEYLRQFLKIRRLEAALEKERKQQEADAMDPNQIKDKQTSYERKYISSRHFHLSNFVVSAFRHWFRFRTGEGPGHAGHRRLAQSRKCGGCCARIGLKPESFKSQFYRQWTSSRSATLLAEAFEPRKQQELSSGSGIRKQRLDPQK